MNDKDREKILEAISELGFEADCDGNSAQFRRRLPAEYASLPGPGKKPFTARLADPDPEWLDSIIHVMPGAEKNTPAKELIIDYMMSLDPAMIAGLSGVYVRAGQDDDRQILDISKSDSDRPLYWSRDSHKNLLGWHWKSEHAIVVNMELIPKSAKKTVKEVWPEDENAATWDFRAEEIIFEQFFITLGHEIRHAALDFPLTPAYCEIYPNAERDFPGDVKNLRAKNGRVSRALLEADAEEWGAFAFESWNAKRGDKSPRKSAQSKPSTPRLK